MAITRSRWIRIGLLTAGPVALAGALVALPDSWPAVARDQWARLTGRGAHGAEEAHGHDHDSHDPSHGHADGDAHGHDADDHDRRGDHIEISEQARKNIGLRVSKLEPTTFSRTVTVPGMVIEKPGRSDVQVTAPLAGVITRIYPLKGETVEAGQPLFDLRLTHEEVVQAQTELLRTVEELDVVRREIDRLESITSGTIPHKDVLARKYEQQKLQGAQRAQVQALLLHGLTEKHVEAILATRHLLKVVTIHAPHTNADRSSTVSATQTTGSPTPSAPRRVVTVSGSQPSAPESPPYFELEELNVDQGQHVQVGQALCVLGNHALLYIEGRAFEREAELLSRAMQDGWAVTASLNPPAGNSDAGTKLRVVYMSNKVDPESRTFRFYLDLPNEIARDSVSTEGHRFIDWRFKPGQRVQLQIPVEQWPDRLVVPIDAVVQEGPETFVFVQEGDRFERRAVHVEYRDARSAVLAGDAEIKAGDAIVVSGAYQLQIAMKNKAGGAVDPHAGHNH